MCGIQKNDTCEPICRAGIDIADIENGHMDMVKSGEWDKFGG